MADDVEFDYEYLMHNALRGLMRDVLSMVADLADAPGEHHFYIEFLTQAPGVVIPEILREEYPERMTIVLQHQFENLTVDDHGFGVTLWFKGKEARLQVPFEAVMSFADPSAQFGLRFEPVENVNKPDAPKEEKDAAPVADNAEKENEKEETDPPNKNGGADVVSLDSFRKK